MTQPELFGGKSARNPANVQGPPLPLWWVEGGWVVGGR